MMEIKKLVVPLFKFALSMTKGLGNAILVLGGMITLTYALAFYTKGNPTFPFELSRVFTGLVDSVKMYVFWGTWIYETWSNFRWINKK